jgi:hypothetical protein
MASVDAMADSDAAMASDFQWADQLQACNDVVLDATVPMDCSFETASLREYVAVLYCKDIDNNWYGSAAVSEFTALDNGGQAFNMALTYGTAIDVVTNNDVVLEVACAISVGLQVPSNRVTDELGGFCGSPSPLVATAAVEEEAADDAADATEEAADDAADATEGRVKAFARVDDKK